MHAQLDILAKSTAGHTFVQHNALAAKVVARVCDGLLLSPAHIWSQWTSHIVTNCPENISLNFKLAKFNHFRIGSPRFRPAALATAKANVAVFCSSTPPETSHERLRNVLNVKAF